MQQFEDECKTRTEGVWWCFLVLFPILHVSFYWLALLKFHFLKFVFSCLWEQNYSLNKTEANKLDKNKTFIKWDILTIGYVFWISSNDIIHIIQYLI